MDALSSESCRGPEREPASEPQAASPRVAATVARLWQRFRPVSLERVQVIEDAVLALQRGVLDPELRQRAGHDAHKLAGSLGTFGFPEGTRLARELERVFRADRPLNPSDATRLYELATALRRELTVDSPRPAAEPAAITMSSGAAPLVLIVDDDSILAERLVLEAVAWGLRARVANDLPAARAALEQELPDVVLLDLTFPAGCEPGLAFLKELHAWQPSLPVLVFTGSQDFTDRVAVARLGARGFVQKPSPPAQVMDAVMQVVHRSHTADARVMVVDDDPQILEAVSDLLGDHRISVIGLDDPRRFWDTLEEASPDLLVLDIEMPHLTGLELCRVVRTDPRWHELPVLCLTAHNDSSTRYRMFEAGADDYVTKPFVPPELVTRVVNRLERTRLHRAMAETDALTGAANRRKAGQVLSRYLRLAERHGQPVSVAVLDLDHFKQVNDSHGHGAGDAVLRRLGQLLHSFRGEDVVARWGGEEFVVGMYGTTRGHAVHRLAEVLEHLRGEEFRSADGQSFHVSFSAGVAEYPTDGTDLQALYRAADEALYRAKAAGRDRVLPASQSDGPGQQAARVDVALVCEDAPAARALLRALETRGYQTRWLTEDDIARRLAQPDSPPLDARVFLVDADRSPGVAAALTTRLAERRMAAPSRLIVLTDHGSAVRGLAVDGDAIERLSKPLDHRLALQRIRRVLEASPAPKRPEDPRRDSDDQA